MAKSPLMDSFLTAVRAAISHPTSGFAERSADITLLLILCISFSIPVAAQNPILFEQGDFQPPQQMEMKTANEAEVERYGIVQFKNLPSEQQRKNLEDKYGLKLLNYIPENAWLARIPPEHSNELRKNQEITYIGNIPPHYKIDSNLQKQGISNGKSKELRVTVFREVDSQTSKQTIEKYGEIISSEQNGSIWNVKSSSNNIRDLASEEIVKRISQGGREPKPALDNSRSLIEADNLQFSPYNLTGDGMTAALWDGGWAKNHSDLNYTGKMIYGDKGAECGSNCGLSFHATNVAGVMIGGGILNNNLRGIAPDARGISYEYPTSSLNELYNETQHAINHDAVLSQNSWVWSLDNYTDFGRYDSFSQAYDDIIADTSTTVDDTLSVIFAAGNEGNKDYPSRYETIPGPGATAKNTITVGATRDDGSMTSFSSWGPIEDGRIKPDIVANGYNVNTTEPGNKYAGKHGTSIASPAVSGLVVLINQKFNQTYGRKPSPATTKGLLIGSATDLNRTGPDYIYGWGLANATEAIEIIEEDETKNLIRNGEVGDGETIDYSVEPEASGVNITLVWSDYPASTSSSKHLVNDLDLVVQNSTGHRYHPWTLNGSEPSEPASRDREDRTNNVEQVFVPSDESLTVTVEGHNVPEPKQSYSLVFTPSIKDSIPPDITVHSPVEKTYSEQPDFNISASEDLHNAFLTAEGANHSMSENSVYYINDTIILEDGSHDVALWANDTAGNLAQEWVNFTIDAEPPNIDPISPNNNANISGKNLSIEATWNNTGTEIEEANYSIRNKSGTFLEGSLNDTVSIDLLEDGHYNITYTAVSEIGNKRQKNLSITVDTQKPSVNLHTPENSPVNGSFYVNATFQDLSGVKEHNYTIRNSTGQQASLDLNTSYNSLEILDGKYSIGYEVVDYAGNTAVNQSHEEITVNNNPPSINPQKPVENGNISKKVNISATAESRGAEIDRVLYRLRNTTQNLTEWRDINQTYLNTTNYLDGKYNLTFKANDTTGLTQTKEIQIQIDNKPPEINLTEYNISEKTYNGWIIDDHTVQVKCSDNRSGVDLTSVTGPIYDKKTGHKANFTISKSGNNNYSFRCHDRAGNVKSAEKSLKIDLYSPKIQSVSPSNGSTTGLSPTITAEINDESQESGLNLSESDLETSKGTIDDISWTNSSVEIQLSDLDYSESYSVTGEVSDNVNHTYNVFLEFDTESDDSGSDSTSSSSSSSSSATGGFSGSTSLTSDPEPEIITENHKFEITNLELSEDSKTLEISETNMSIDEVSISGSISSSDSISFQKIGDPIIQEPEQTTAYSYLEIETSSSEDFKTNITHTIEKDWFNSSRSPQNVSLYRMNNEWQKLDTELTENRSNFYKYKSEIPRFSTFVIAAKKQDICQEEPYGLNPETNECQRFTSCEIPEDWQEVESCDIAETRETAQNTIESAEDKVSNKEAEQKLKEAKKAFRNDDYTSSKQLAEEAVKLENQKTSTSGIISAITENREKSAVLAALAAILITGVYYIVQIWKKRKLIESVEALKQVIRDPTIKRELDRMEKEIDTGDYDAAAEETEEIIKRMRRKQRQKINR